MFLDYRLVYEKKESDLRRGRHCVFRMHVHLVFVTKYRRNVFTKEVLDDLKIFFEKVCLDFESELVEIIRQYIEQQQTPA